MIGDRHIHTLYSPDCGADVRDVLNAAIAKGMKEICITDHCDFDLGPRWILDPEKYAAAMEQYKKEYAGRLDVHIGIEIGLNPDYNDKINAFLAAYPFEWVIGSIHSMLGDDPYYRQNYKMDDPAFFRTYFETALNCLKAGNPIDVFGHFDYVVRYGEQKAVLYDPSRYAGITDEILKILIDRKIALELNTGGLRKGLDFVHPHRTILDRYKELGGTLVAVGSDAHAAADVGSGFETVEALIEEYGFCPANYRVSPGDPQA